MIKFIVAIFLASIALVASASQNYASFSTNFEKGQCEVFAWVPDDGARIKVSYGSEARKRKNGTYSCEVRIPLKEFEKRFIACFLSGISYTREGKHFPHSASFNGGAAHGRDDIYWFNWSDAEYTYADFLCQLK